MLDYLKKFLRPDSGDQRDKGSASTDDIMADFGSAFEMPENLPTDRIDRKAAAGNSTKDGEKR